MDGPCGTERLPHTPAAPTVISPDRPNPAITPIGPPTAAQATPSGAASLMSPPPMPRPTSKYHAGHSNPHANGGCHTHAMAAATAGGTVNGSGNLRSRMS